MLHKSDYNNMKELDIRYGTKLNDKELTIAKRIQNWNYIATLKCIQDSGVNHYSASKILKWLRKNDERYRNEVLSKRRLKIRKQREIRHLNHNIDVDNAVSLLGIFFNIELKNEARNPETASEDCGLQDEDDNIGHNDGLVSEHGVSVGPASPI